jgi:hypothetical protein
MKKLVLEEFEVESFVTTPDSESRLGTVHGHSGEDPVGSDFTEWDTCTRFTQDNSCMYSDCGTCEFSCANSCAFTCPATCRFTCNQS